MDQHLREVAPVSVRIRDLSVQFEAGQPPWARLLALSKKPSNSRPPKTILDNISADMPAGSLTAIIGGSGSGKTTLLNTIARRVTTKKLRVTGTISFNQNETANTFRSSYVMQQDVLLPSLTVRETLQYAADLRLPPPSTAEERQAAVEQVILELGLKECADTRIGNNIHKGCSGGEKRRTSIGVQMLANPSVLYCDEPTTGLDAYSAYQTVKSLKALAETRRTVIMSIHAPRSEIWSLFDRVILLSKGTVLYSGPTEFVADYFADCGHELPPFVNPAEFLIDLAAVDNRSEEAEKGTTTRVLELRESWKQRPQSEKTAELIVSSPKADNDVSEGYSLDQRVGFRRQVWVLTRRTVKVTIRDRLGLAGSLFEVIIMSIITGWIFYGLKRDLQGIRSREGAAYTAAALQGYLILMFETYRLTVDIQVFDRERSEGVVTAPAFLISRRLARFFLEDLPVPIMYSIIYYFMVGYRIDAPTFFIFLALMIIGQFIAVTLASVCVAVSRDFATASLIANLAYTVQSFCSGYFVQALQIPIYVRWVKWTAYVFFIFGSLSHNEFIGVNGGYYGQFYDCPHSNDPTDPACQQYVGRYIMQSLGLPENWLWRPLVCAASFIVAFFILSILILSFWRVDITMAQPRKAEEESHFKDKMRSRSTQDVRQVTLGLSGYQLEVKRRHVWKKTFSKKILQPISATFQPGKINVIIGPSGCGKTSLLQSLAQRLRSTYFSQYHSSGDITLNDAVPASNVLKSVVSFVTQDDDALLASLTVRETLHFAAQLRLPSWMSKREKIHRAEDIILKMGLKDCADNLVGSELVKGISGGEKRRVSIAVQVLTDPKVLLLDEPTSGLDAFTASSVIDVLKSLADEGRTVIMTVHQARSDMYQRFDNLLILARGGSLVYTGSRQNMLPHFQSLGHECPETTNPLDFTLDLIAVDLQEETKETESRAKVQKIIDAWEPTPISVSSKILTPAEISSFAKQKTPFHTAFPIIVRRSALNIRRSPDILNARTMQVLGISIVAALFFAPLKSNYEAVQSRMGFIQEVAAIYFVGVLQNVAVYPMERDIFYRERADECYTSSTFLLAYTLLELPFTAATSMVFGVLASYAANLKRTPAMLFIAAFNCFCVVTCGESIGIIFCTFFSHAGFALNITSVLLTISTIMTGILSINLPSVLQAFNHLSPLRYQVANMAVYAMRGQKFTCEPSQKVNGECPISTGQQVLELYNLDTNPGLNLMALGIATVVYRLIAYMVVKFATMQWKSGQVKLRFRRKGQT